MVQAALLNQYHSIILVLHKIRSNLPMTAHLSRLKLKRTLVHLIFLGLALDTSRKLVGMRPKMHWPTQEIQLSAIFKQDLLPRGNRSMLSRRDMLPALAVI